MLVQQSREDAITRQHLLTQTVKVLLVLPLQRVADSANPMCEDLRLPAPAACCLGFLIT